MIRSRRDLKKTDGVGSQFEQVILDPHPVDVQQGRLTTEGVDLLHEPLKKLGGLWRLREDPGGPAKTHGPHALQLPPDADAMPGR